MRHWHVSCCVACLHIGDKGSNVRRLPKGCRIAKQTVDAGLLQGCKALTLFPLGFFFPLVDFLDQFGLALDEPFVVPLLDLPVLPLARDNQLDNDVGEIAFEFGLVFFFPRQMNPRRRATG